MKNENSKLLLGLGLGAVVGIAVGYLLTGDNRKKLSEELHEVGNGVKDGVKSAFSKVKSKAEYAGSRMADRMENMAEKVKDKAGEWAERADVRTSEMADDVSQRANDARRRMDNKAEMDGEAHRAYADDFDKDVENVKRRERGNANTKA